MKNELTLYEMTALSIPISRKDPLTSHQMPSFYYTSDKQSTNKKSKSKIQAPANEDPIIKARPVPATHYIESRFDAYSRAKLFNRPLFSEISKSTERQLAEHQSRPSSNSRYQTSRYPKVPLSKEMTEKFETLNNFKEISKKKIIPYQPTRPISTLSVSRKFFKLPQTVENFKSWEQLKKQTFDQKKKMICKTKPKVKKVLFTTIDNFNELPKSESFNRDYSGSPYLIESPFDIDNDLYIQSPLKVYNDLLT